MESDLRGSGRGPGYSSATAAQHRRRRGRPGRLSNTPRPATWSMPRNNLFTCSQDSRQDGRSDQGTPSLPVVVASCSPDHEGLFRELREAGLEPLPLRERTSGIRTPGPTCTSRKRPRRRRKGLVRMAIAKAEFLKPLKPGQLSVNHATSSSAAVLPGSLLPARCRPRVSFHHRQKEADSEATTEALLHPGGPTRNGPGELSNGSRRIPLIRVFTGPRSATSKGYRNYKTTVAAKGNEETSSMGS